MIPHIVRHDGALFLQRPRPSGPDPWLKLDAFHWAWTAASEGTASLAGAEPMDPRAALAWLHRERLCRLVPVSVVGPRDPTPTERATALALGDALGRLGLPVLCGGKTGVMEAVAEGVHRAGGLSIGMVPDNEWQAANGHIALPLATGLGPARNILIARACVAMVAVGGHYGTITEVAYALHFDKPVYGLVGAPEIDGVAHYEDVDDVVDALVPILLRLPDGGERAEQTVK